MSSSSCDELGACRVAFPVTNPGVRVVAADQRTCRVPVGDAGPANLVARNLDDAGQPIPGEAASEYSAVVIPLVTGHYMMLRRNLRYTGVTRRKKLVVLVGSRKALRIAIRNNKPVARCTQLRRRLQDGG